MSEWRQLLTRMSNRALDALPVEDATVIPSARLLLPGTSSSALYPSANERSDRGENLCPRPVRSASLFFSHSNRLLRLFVCRRRSPGLTIHSGTEASHKPQWGPRGAPGGPPLSDRTGDLPVNPWFAWGEWREERKHSG